jgi:hypothetical protein
MPIASSDIVATTSSRSQALSLPTLVSIAACAAALAGMARQVIGQAVATRLLAADWISSSSALAQVHSPTRLAGVCGTLATLFLGAGAALLIRVDKRLTAGWYFLWVFGCVSLMNSGRLLYSALTGTGDWAVVIASFHSPWLWRIAIAAAGVFIYRPALRFAVTTLRDLIEGRELAYRDLWPLILAAYLAAGMVLTAGAALDPVNKGLVAVAVVFASFGLNLGLLVIPAFIPEPVESVPITAHAIGFSWLWLFLGVATSAAFVAGLGRVIHV